jgi:hypothetical protein
MPNYGSSKQNTGGAKPGAAQPAGKNFDAGQQGGFGNNKGSRRMGAGLKNDDGGGGGKFVDTSNDAQGGGHGGSLKHPRAGDA